MLGSFDYSVTFKVPAKTLSGKLALQQGLSAITGPNEAGKSTVLELIRFAFFGSPALRAKRDTYEKISVILDFTLKGEAYTIRRTLGNATLAHGGKMIASGTTAVNEKVEQLFGYGMAVFDIAHFCQQGDVEALTKMKPLDRKKMIDRVIGMDQLDVAAASVAQESSELRATIKTMSSMLGAAPAEPTKPNPYYHTDTIKKFVSDLEPQVEELRNIKAWLKAHPQRDAPVLPTTTITETVEELQAQEQAREAAVVRRESLWSQIKNVPYQPDFTAEQLDEIEAEWKAHCAWLDEYAYARQHGYEPWWTTEGEVLAWLRVWALIKKHRTLTARLQQLELHQLQCPKCSHEWLPEGGGGTEARNIRQELAALGEAPEPPIDEADLIRTLDGIRAWAKWRAAGRLPTTPCPAPQRGSRVFNETVLQGYRQALGLIPLHEEFQSIVIPEPVTKQLRERQRYEDALQDYERLESLWHTLEDDRASQTARAKELDQVEKELEDWKRWEPACIQYDALMGAYMEAATNWALNRTLLAERQAELDQLEAAADAVKSLRSKIKAYLVPSLNVAASNLISLMTGGQRSFISIDEDFSNILVDGQPVETLSGSAKAVANLAIRLGLGQVLTNKVFSVFLGDEIDASFDDARADYTASALEGLNSVIKQIILVSHKDLSVQHQIKIG